MTVDIENRAVRKNGFQFPCHPQQISTYVVFGFDLITFYGVNMLSMGGNPTVVVSCGTAYGLICVAVVVLAWKATSCDPTDAVLYEQLAKKAKSERFNPGRLEYRCFVCDGYVTDRAKHCGECNRCVETFDHHCRWLNNCVGAKNYCYFFSLICSVFLMSLMHNITSIIVIVHFWALQTPHVSQTHLSVFTKNLFTEFTVLLGVACTFNLATLGFLIHLIGYHVMLMCKGLTTFEYLRGDKPRTSKLYIKVVRDTEADVELPQKKAPLPCVCTTVKDPPLKIEKG